MDNLNIDLPALILFENYKGNFTRYIEALYQIFLSDFIKHKTRFRGEELRLKWHPQFQEKAYTFYHLTHSGNDEDNRLPDFRRCERLPWARPTIENCDQWMLKIWPQKRKGADRLCIWLERIGEPDYFVILDVRKDYKLVWTAFVAEYEHEKRKKFKEYKEWLKTQKSPDKPDDFVTPLTHG